MVQSEYGIVVIRPGIISCRKPIARGLVVEEDSCVSSIRSAGDPEVLTLQARRLTSANSYAAPQRDCMMNSGPKVAVERSNSPMSLLPLFWMFLYTTDVSKPNMSTGTLKITSTAVPIMEAAYGL